MKTEISDFCKEYSRALIPAGAALDAVISRIEQDSQEGVLRLNLAGFNEVKHRLKSLIDKVEGQQAYLLIFGPLKSGKSTLMNAISGAYVSEVTSLPAYPCLVYVRHGERATIKLTRYNGRETATEDKNVMEVLINDSHSNLADRIRRVEEQGREFDPGLDYPEAIRRVDIDLAAKDLNESGTVLVDTPGLYSRMKFGYDLMTREFRNSAACAVFVVKTDNLFLEQVFQEFNDLLGLFSRVFLVVNIDSSKRDLRPDGSLQPSLESENPQKIIDAFQLLSMSAALRKASKEGRLKIYPIDLLNAASRHLQAGNSDNPENKTPAAETDSETTAENSTAEADAQPPDRPDDFNAFLNDLTEYLNSSDYLFELMNDSFRQGDALRAEMSRHCSTDSAAHFIEQQRRLRAEAEEVDEQLLAVKNLADFDWEKAFENTYADTRREAIRFAEGVRGELQKALQSGVDHWFETSDCLDDLAGKTWRPQMEALQKQISGKMAGLVKGVLDTSAGGARPAPELVIALDRVWLSLRDVYNRSIGALSAAPPVSECAIHLDAETIPVNRTFWDRILFRSQAKVRRRLFGVDQLTNEVSPQKKRRRLLPDGKAALEQCVETHLRSLLPSAPTRCSKDFLQIYIGRFKKDFADLLQSRKAELGASKQSLQSRIQANERISKTFEKLTGAISELENEMAALRQKFLRSARLARGFQALENSTAAFSLWTWPYCGGVQLVPGGMSRPEELEELIETESESEDKATPLTVASAESAEATQDSPETSVVEVESTEETEAPEQEPDEPTAADVAPKAPEEIDASTDNSTLSPSLSKED